MREIQDLRIHGYRQLALGMIALFIVIALGRFAYTPILPFMQLDTGLDNKSVGLLATFNYLGYLIGAMLPIFYIMKNKVFDLKCYLLLNVATMLLFGVTDHFVIWSLLRLLNGISSGAVFVLASNIVLEALHLARREGIAGLLYSAVGLGLFSSSLFIFLYTDVTHWRETWIWLGSAAFILTLIIIVCLRENPTLPEPASHKAHGPEKVIRYSKKFYIPFAIAYFCEGAGYIITGTFLVAIVKTMPTLSEYAALSWMFVGLGAIPATVLWSMIGQRIGICLSVILAFLLQIVAVLMPIFTVNAFAIALSSMIFGATFLGLTTLFMSKSHQITFETKGNNLVAVMTLIYSVGQMIAPYISGILIERTHSYNDALIFAAAILVVGILSSLYSKRYAHPM
ncbi:YbfB/YjiJ family MFS transporter [Staphylococcus pseudintermedius]|uniref:YbfB/YjiJ family MFS transporter n=2 Tax=Staphylococcus pseudintermedius TaxID=283734 RepID=A0A8H9C1K9_STAPS|nr:YbfB/YjiJ family MFS transporter [Staphylococcus pseudintermedius]ADV06777.1 putative permease of the major facilitator superfamily [Staphylococcus pseudintermedius HKU10-03]ADX75564.1 transporter, major facilitator family [Staphylococcus pseudintermedius ED99]EGQ0294835.1 YbfB/YjiJ family MFS transporter [Staphylococcus pseudintermedius]EGQ0297507.1 YbfB/YjiJ family MFS transporter [Staphylococcus pseudintermedius]EGQ0302662.1 YbfB/YjiJ family MFS transporter [Staphylococcus pseudintermedi